MSYREVPDTKITGRARLSLSPSNN